MTDEQKADLRLALVQTLMEWRWQILLPPQTNGLDVRLEVAMTEESCENFAGVLLEKLG